MGAGVGLLYAALGPIKKNVDPQLRRNTLLKVARPSLPEDDLSPLASRLREHVRFLAGEIGERPIYKSAAIQRAQEYIETSLKSSGLSPHRLVYKNPTSRLYAAGNPFINIEATVGESGEEKKGIWIVGAHYDTAPGTPGADDNASAVAVLLELARLLKESPIDKTVRLVVFGTEEPPSFGTHDMGSHHYSAGLRGSLQPISGVLILEMLGYFNSSPGSQLYPPFLHWFYPNQGDFISLTSNFSSRGLLRKVKKLWHLGSPVPVSSVVLPSVLSKVALSDQLNFWAFGYPAVMVSDTAFYRNPHYHEPTDDPSTLDYERMAQVTETLLMVVSQIE